jgi:beta-N-acetylhexosaminidase
MPIQPPRLVSRLAPPLLAAVLAALAVAGVVVAVRPADPASLAAAPVPPAPPTAAPTALPVPDGPPPCGQAVAALSPRDRLAQRLVVGVDAADPAEVVETVRATQVGGIFLGGEATALLRDDALEQVQAVAKIPVAVSVDDEGGRVQRIDALDGQLPSARRLAARYTPDQVRDLARKRGEALAARGITVNFAPTVDVGRQPANAAIGDRSFSGDPAVVARFAAAFAEGQRAAGILPVLKHFPGHGHANGDSHKGRVTTPPLATLRTTDLRPYADLLGTGPLAVMVGHLDVPGLTDGLPASLTPAAYRLLRDDYGFDGLVVTDDLGAMKAVTDTFALPEAVVRAMAAGADEALWSSGAEDAAAVGPVLDLLEKALADGRLDPAANDLAVTRSLAARGVCSRSGSGN